MPMDVEERYERRAPFGVPFAESFGLHLLVIGALATSVWLHSRIRGNEWGQNLDGAIQANLVSNAPSIPLPQIQKPTDNVLATENPSPAPAIEKQETVENLAARAAVFEAQNDVDKASADLRRATQLAPRNVFEAAAQSAARQKLQQLAKRIPCGSVGSAKGDGTCL